MLYAIVVAVFDCVWPVCAVCMVNLTLFWVIEIPLYNLWVHIEGYRLNSN
jgi:hypothetical protein